MVKDKWLNYTCTSIEYIQVFTFMKRYVMSIRVYVLCAVIYVYKVL
jgi:hypothetical protein